MLKDFLLSAVVTGFVSVLVGFVSMTLSTFVSLLKPGGKARNDAAFT